MKMFELFEVGGAVRDSITGVPTKDVDFVAVALIKFSSVNVAFDGLVRHLNDEGFTIYMQKPEFLTVRAGVPVGHPLRSRTREADFVLARRDGPYSDGRRPDWVKPGSLLDDLARRDFTVNAIARDFNDNIIDPFDGEQDIRSNTLRFVGDPTERVAEDSLRILRGLRFMVTKGLVPTPETWDAMNTDNAVKSLAFVSMERIAEELAKMFEFDTLGSLALLRKVNPKMELFLFRNGLRLAPTFKK